MVLTSPKVKIISLNVSETSLATSLGFTPMRCRASLSQTAAPFTKSMVMTFFVDRWCTISGICAVTNARHHKRCLVIFSTPKLIKVRLHSM